MKIVLSSLRHVFQFIQSTRLPYTHTRSPGTENIKTKTKPSKSRMTGKGPREFPGEIGMFDVMIGAMILRLHGSNQWSKLYG